MNTEPLKVTLYPPTYAYTQAVNSLGKPLALDPNNPVRGASRIDKVVWSVDPLGVVGFVTNPINPAEVCLTPIQPGTCELRVSGVCGFLKSSETFPLEGKRTLIVETADEPAALDIVKR